MGILSSSKLPAGVKVKLGYLEALVSSVPRIIEVDRWIDDTTSELRLSVSSEAERTREAMFLSRTADLFFWGLHVYKSDCAYFECYCYVTF